MKKLLIGLLVAALLLLACGPEETAGTQPGAGGADNCEEGNLPLFEEGVLTVATDKPAYPPWFEGNPKSYSGFEGDLAAEVADRLGVPIKWVVEPFNKSYAPGAKDYDFDVNQISITPERSKVVDFSDRYFTNNQGFLALKGNHLTLHKPTIAILKTSKLGAQVGTTSLAFINEVIDPSTAPKVYDTTNDVKSALEAGQIDALVTDVVTTVYLRDFEFKGAKVVGQYPTEEGFGMLFEKGNPLVECVNEVLAEIKDDGTLQQLEDEWLQDYLKVPTIPEA
jgi:polar amino acid transport system substrate-binding protein